MDLSRASHAFVTGDSFRGIAVGAPYILTHGGGWRDFEKRMLAIKAACDVAKAG